MDNVIPFPIRTCLYHEDSPVYKGEVCESCFISRAIDKSKARHIRHHLRSCKRKNTCLLCISFGEGYSTAIDFVATGY